MANVCWIGLGLLFLVHQGNCQSIEISLGSTNVPFPGINYPKHICEKENIYVHQLQPVSAKDCEIQDLVPNLYIWVGDQAPVVEVLYRYSDSWFGSDERVQRCQRALNSQGLDYHSYTQEDHTIWGGLGQDEYLLRCKGVRPLSTSKEWARFAYTNCLDYNHGNMIWLDFGNGYLVSESMMLGAVFYGSGTSGVRGLHDREGVLSTSGLMFWAPLTPAFSVDGNSFGLVNDTHVPHLQITLGDNETIWARYPNQKFAVSRGRPDNDMVAVSCFNHMLVYVTWRQGITHVRLGLAYSAVTSVHDSISQFSKVERAWYVNILLDIVSYIREALYSALSFVVNFVITVVVDTATFNWLLWLFITVCINKYLGYFPVSGIVALVSVFALGRYFN